MARKRMLDPRLWASDQFAALSPLARLLWIGLISNADDEGRLHGSARHLRHLVFPLDDYTLDQVASWRDEVVAQGLAVSYEADGTHYLALPKWRLYQRVEKPYPSKFPAAPEGPVTAPPCADHSGNGRGTVGERSPHEVQVQVQVQREVEEEPAAAPAAAAAPPATGEVASRSSGGSPPRARPNRFREVLDALRARGIDYKHTSRDAAAVKDCSAAPELIADAYAAAANGEWDDEFVLKHLSLWFICPRIAAYEALRSGIHARASPNARPRTAAEGFARMARGG